MPSVSPIATLLQFSLAACTYISAALCAQRLGAGADFAVTTTHALYSTVPSNWSSTGAGR